MKDQYTFYDPNHGGCLRVVRKVDKNTYIINGAYGSDEGGKGYWTAIATKVKEKKKDQTYNLRVDFKYKKKIKHKPVYYALWKGRTIQWEDGNSWLELYA